MIIDTIKIRISKVTSISARVCARLAKEPRNYGAPIISSPLHTTFRASLPMTRPISLRSSFFPGSFRRASAKNNAQNRRPKQSGDLPEFVTREFHAPRRPIRHYLLRSRLDENSARSDPSAAASSSYIVRAEPLPAHSRNSYIPSLSNDRWHVCIAHARSSTWTVTDRSVASNQRWTPRGREGRREARVRVQEGRNEENGGRKKLKTT